MRYGDLDKVDLRIPFSIDTDGEILVPLSAVKMALHQVPTEDIVKVVRCKDCKYIYHNPNLGTYRCPRFLSVVDKNDFCSYGERKDSSND